jgi:hypothetical protein
MITNKTKNCKTGFACGSSCISKKKACRKTAQSAEAKAKLAELDIAIKLAKSKLENLKLKQKALLNKKSKAAADKQPYKLPVGFDKAKALRLFDAYLLNPSPKNEAVVIKAGFIKTSLTESVKNQVRAIKKQLENE